MEYRAHRFAPEEIIVNGNAVWKQNGVERKIDLARLVKGPLKGFFETLLNDPSRVIGYPVAF